MALSAMSQFPPTGNGVYHLRLAIILILKHAAPLCLSGTSARIAIAQAESDFQNSNVASRIEEQFPGSYEEYSVEEFVHFIVDTNIAA